MERSCDDIGSMFVGASMATQLLMGEAMKEHMELLDDHNEPSTAGKMAFEITAEKSHHSSDDTFR